MAVLGNIRNWVRHSILNSISIYERKGILKYIIVPIALALPPIVLHNAEVLGAIEFFNSHKYIRAIFGFWPLTYFVLHFLYMKFRPQLDIDAVRLMTLLDIIDDIIGSKIERFGKHAKRILDSDRHIEDAAIFREITQPSLQINHIVRGIWTFFRDELDDKQIELKVALAKMDDKHITEFVCFYPNDKGPFSKIVDLRVDHCCFSRALQKSGIIVIDNLAKMANLPVERSDFVFTSEENRDTEGSMICYPVRHRNLGNIPYVISVLVMKRNYFSIDYVKTYEFILDKFAKRIALEYGLLVLKEKVR